MSLKYTIFGMSLLLSIVTANDEASVGCGGSGTGVLPKYC